MGQRPRANHLFFPIRLLPVSLSSPNKAAGFTTNFPFPHHPFYLVTSIKAPVSSHSLCVRLSRTFFSIFQDEANVGFLIFGLLLCVLLSSSSSSGFSKFYIQSFVWSKWVLCSSGFPFKLALGIGGTSHPCCSSCDR